MVSNPADLQRAQARQPADAARRNRVIQNYRTGTTTEAEKGEGESAGSIRDLGG
jgi:type IV pilus biogenesis protein CpaD/CtpE